MTFLTIDGSLGEGGGQVLRTALSLSILTQKPIEFTNIRAKRKKPGLLRQHLTSVKAAQAICNAKTEGVEFGASRLRFTPGNIKADSYYFAIGTAGSTALVCQTILPVLALSDAPSTITLEGGTHNGMSPSLCFLQHAYFPIIERMGVKCEVNTQRFGFYPAGGGKWQLTIMPTSHFKPLHLLDGAAHLATDPQHCRMRALLSKLPKTIGEREIKTAREELNWSRANAQVDQVESKGPGNSLHLVVQADTHCNVFEVIGEKGVSAESVAKRCAGQVKKFLAANAAVEEHLVDQLLLPMALAGAGSFTTTVPSLHTRTNIDIIQQFLDIPIAVVQVNESLWKLTLGIES
ncbi:MAG: RNA 3'-terminal phosphate cyclase [Spirochaetota bacterium]